MTIAQYAASRPDLAVNWERAFLPQNANDTTAAWVRNFGTLAAYLRNDYGRPFDGETSSGAGGSSAMSGKSLVILGAAVLGGIWLVRRYLAK